MPFLALLIGRKGLQWICKFEIKLSDLDATSGWSLKQLAQTKKLRRGYYLVYYSWFPFASKCLLSCSAIHHYQPHTAQWAILRLHLTSEVGFCSEWLTRIFFICSHLWDISPKISVNPTFGIDPSVWGRFMALS